MRLNVLIKKIELNTEGSGDVKIRSEKGGELVLHNVLYSKEYLKTYYHLDSL